MTPKEKAKELVEKMINTYNTTSDFVYNSTAKQCALITVEEILKAQPSYRYWETYDDETPSAITFWNEVKEEINKL
jgi:hypothetical protein